MWMNLGIEVTKAMVVALLSSDELSETLEAITLLDKSRLYLVM